MTVPTCAGVGQHGEAELWRQALMHAGRTSRCCPRAYYSVAATLLAWLGCSPSWVTWRCMGIRMGEGCDCYGEGVVSQSSTAPSGTHPTPPEGQRRRRRQRSEEGLADVDVRDGRCGCRVPYEDAVRVQHHGLVLPIRLHNTRHRGAWSWRPQLSHACSNRCKHVPPHERTPQASART